MPIVKWIELSPRQLVEAVNNMDRQSVNAGVPVDFIGQQLNAYAGEELLLS